MASTHTIAAMMASCLKSLLMIFNFAFWVSGIAILVIGIWMQFKLNKFLELSTEYSNTASYVLIVTGSIIVISGFLACCCTVKGQPGHLYAYSVFLFLIMILEISAGLSLFFYRNRLSEGFDIGLNQSMINYRNSSSQHDSDLDFLQSTLHCCGNHNYTDWIVLNPPVPSSCCIKEGCDVHDSTQIYSEGCFDKVVNFLMSHFEIVAGSAVGLALFPLIGVLLSCCLARTVKTSNYQPMD